MRYPLQLVVGLALAACGGKLIGSSDTHTPQLGRYQFDTTWPITGFVQPAEAHGTLTITSAGAGQIEWRFDLAETAGTVSKSSTSTGAANEYIVVSGTIGRAGLWQLLPHLTRTGGAYGCSGNALNTGTFSGTAMTCTWTYLGP